MVRLRLVLGIGLTVDIQIGTILNCRPVDLSTCQPVVLSTYDYCEVPLELAVHVLV